MSQPRDAVAEGSGSVPVGLLLIEQALHRARPQLVRVLRSFRIPPEDARDLVQNVYLSYLEHADSIEFPERWMVVALRRECLHHARSERRRLYQAVDEALLDLVACPTAAPQERESLLHLLGERIRRLGERCRELLRLRYRLGCDRAETAHELGVRPSSIGTLERRCLDELGESVLAGADGDR